MTAVPENPLAQAIRHHQAGQFAQAEQFYRQALAQNPRQPDALRLLGLLAHQVGRHDVAVQLIAQAIGINGGIAEYHSDLGLACQAMGKLPEAVQAYQTAVRLKPGFAEAHFNLGNALKLGGQAEAAMACYRTALQIRPTFAEAHNNLGNALKDQGKWGEAVAAFRMAVQHRPAYTEALNNLGNALKAVGQAEEAVQAYREVLRLRPGSGEAWFNLGNLLQSVNRLPEAVEAYRQSLACKGGHAEVHTNLGNALSACGLHEEAVREHQEAVRLQPRLFEAHNNLGNALKVARRSAEAEAAYRQALAPAPQCVEAHSNLGSVLKDLGRLDEAQREFVEALRLDPSYAEAYYNWGNALQDLDLLDDAVARYRQAVAVRPQYAAAHNNLANVLKDQGLLSAALAEYREAQRLGSRDAGGNLAYVLHFAPDVAWDEILAAHRQWDQKFAAALRGGGHAHDRNADRRLRVGYVSPDFRNHPIGRFLQPLMAAHDHAAVEVFCYSDVSRPDGLTAQFKQHADQWRDTGGLNHEQLAAQIRADQIDILVDLTMHMQGSRLLVFARKPAPVQVTYLAYCSTTGLSAMDYRLTDRHLDPPGRDLRQYTEATAYLESYWCYGASAEAPEVHAPPSQSRGHITFGCLNNFCKVTEPTLACWAELLRRVPASRLMLYAKEGSHRGRVRDYFAAAGVDGGRCGFVAHMEFDAYFRKYQEIDIALDPFPYCGGTTTCDALWMGVPVVTLAGERAVGRGGVSLLTTVGVPELIAPDIKGYVELATALAGDGARLSDLRQELRGRMRASPLMDAQRAALNLEQAYREMWRKHVARA